MTGKQVGERPGPREHYGVEFFDASPAPGVFVNAVDAATGNRLSASAPPHAALSLAASLIEDHRRRMAGP